MQILIQTISTMENIATSNAAANGDGVYYARAYLRKLIVDHNIGYLRQQNTTDTIAVSNTLHVYPNPVDVSNQIIIETPQQSIKTITIYDLTGRLVLEQKFTENVWTKTMDVSSLNAGIFYIKVATNNGNMLNSTFIKLK